MFRYGERRVPWRGDPPDQEVHDLLARITTVAVFCVSILLLTAADEGKKAVRELALNVTAPAEGAVTRPQVIATAAELAAAFPGAAVRARVVKAVDFDLEQLLLFVWSGSGQDKLIAEFKVLCSKSKESEVVFRYAAGDSTDKKGHARLFVVPKDVKTKWRVETGTGQ